ASSRLSPPMIIWARGTGGWSWARPPARGDGPRPARPLPDHPHPGQAPEIHAGAALAVVRAGEDLVLEDGEETVPEARVGIEGLEADEESGDVIAGFGVDADVGDADFTELELGGAGLAHGSPRRFVTIGPSCHNLRWDRSRLSTRESSVYAGIRGFLAGTT
ncbi:MAG: hypothetical protein OXC91_08200, partial [Rhodobacteraceae bacterium]|nr:hypothetical protein [Paracoccaceae bacterium]